MTQQTIVQMDRLHITGFDSAWGGKQKGAMCDLWFDKETEQVGIDASPVAVTWGDAVQRVETYAKYPHHILTIDQGLVVPNHEGMRPVEKLLSKALGAMDCSAYPSNRSNDSCFGPSAGIWAFLSALDQHGYAHKPMSVPESKLGRYYFECYPHPAIIALLKRERVLKYKCRHRNQAEWQELVDYLKTLPVDNLSSIVDSLALQTKANEDKLDSIVCAWTALLWWRHGIAQSCMIGSIENGYIVTPYSHKTHRQFQEYFVDQMNDDSGSPPALPGNFIVSLPAQAVQHSSSSVVAPMGLDESRWSETVELVATDTTNLSRNIRKRNSSPSKVINDWMDEAKLTGYRLIVKFLDEDAEPEVHFIPHSHSDSQKVLKADRNSQPGLWFLLVAGASKKSPLRFRTKYRYEPLA